MTRTFGSFGPVASIVAASLVVAACGDSLSPDRVAEGITERMIENATDEDVDIDLDFDEDGEGGVSVRTGAGDLAMGTDLPRPDWLPNGFPLPDGLTITYAVNDRDAGQAALGGEASGSLEAVRTQMLAGMEAYGARLLTPDTEERRSLSWELPDGRVAEAALLEITDGGVQLTIGIDAERDATEVEEAATGPRESTGQAVATVDGERFESAGTCQVMSTYANFAASGDPTAAQISVSVQGDSVNGTVSVFDDDGVPGIWILGEGTGTSGSHDDRSISAAGVGMDLMTGATDVEIAIQVTCD